MATQHAPLSRVLALPLRLGRGTDNEAPIFDRNGELRAECVDDDCVERATALIRAANSYDDMLGTLRVIGGPKEVDLVALSDDAIRGMLYAIVSIAKTALAKAEGRS